MAMTLWRLVPGKDYGIPTEVDNLSAFCRKHDLNERKMWNVIRGNTQSYQGWVAKDPNPTRTARIEARAEELMRLFDQGYTISIE
jgi:hypothetical protein